MTNIATKGSQPQPLSGSDGIGDQAERTPNKTSALLKHAIL